MSAFKSFLASDIVITPFEINKSFNAFSNDEGDLIIEGEVSSSGIDRFLGKNIVSSLFNPNADPTTGYLSTEYQRLIYNSIKELYYSNYLSSSYGDPASRQSLVPGRDTGGNRYMGSSSSTAYDNYLQTTLSYPRFFPTGSNDIIGVISIPSTLFGDYIKPNSFYFLSEKGELYDDGEGNILFKKDIVGNIFYSHGLITIVANSDAAFDGEILNFINSTNVTCSFSSSYTIQETQYKCTIRENEFNLSLNPSTISSSTDGTVYGYITESYFAPYITTIGLYDEQQNLLAVGKLAQPLPSSPTTDTTILINIDR